MEINITDYIRPELMVLTVVLYIVGAALKKSAVSDRLIPVILGAAGVLLAMVYVLATSALGTWQDALTAVFTAVTQGVLVAGASVYVNQIFKQLGGK